MVKELNMIFSFSMIKLKMDSKRKDGRWMHLLTHLTQPEPMVEASMTKLWRRGHRMSTLLGVVLSSLFLLTSKSVIMAWGRVMKQKLWKRCVKSSIFHSLPKRLPNLKRMSKEDVMFIRKKRDTRNPRVKTKCTTCK